MNQPVPLLLGLRYMELGISAVDRDLARRNRLFNQWASDYIDRIIKDSEEGKESPSLISLLYKANSKEGNYEKQELID